MKELLEDMQTTLQHIIDNDGCVMLKDSSAEALLEEIENKLREQKQCSQ